MHAAFTVQQDAAAFGPDAGDGEAAGVRWGKTPSWWLDRPEVDADALAVLCALSTFANRQGRCWPSQATLAAKLKRSRAWVNKTLGRLADAGLIVARDRWSENGGRLSCLYELKTDPPGETPPRRDDDAPVVETSAPCRSQRHKQPESEHITDSPAEREPARTGETDRMKRPETQAAPVADDWVPSAEDRVWAEDRHGTTVDIDRHVETFRLRCRAHGYRYRDVGAAWRAWLNQDVAAGKAPSAADSSNPFSPNSFAPNPFAAATQTEHPGAARSAPGRTDAVRRRQTAPHAVAAAERTLDVWRSVAARLTGGTV